MSAVTMAVMAAVLGIGLGVLGYWLRLRLAHESVKSRSERLQREAERERERILHEAQIEGKEALLRVQQDHEREVKRQRDELGGAEKRLRQRETNVERKNELLERRERELKKREGAIEANEQGAKKHLSEAGEKLQDATRQLERVAALSRDEARKQLMAAMEDEARREAAQRVMRIHSEAQAEADARAKSLVAAAAARVASDFVSEKTVSVVELPQDEMKGRIIGREGRNIRAIEAATGVDVIIDDTPEAVILSGFNPVRREIAKRALDRLVADGRIHPARIEEVVQKVTEEMAAVVKRAGEQAIFDLGLHALHPELLDLVGKLKFHAVNGQNAWSHAVETGAIAGILAAELGLNVVPAKRAGLLHDIGRAIGHEVDGSHSQVGAEYARKFGEKSDVVEAIRQHHDAEPQSLLGVLVQAADRLSKDRPGARREQVETYIKRLGDIERISLGFKGVEKAFAVQAGREVRVMVNFQQVSDAEAFTLAKDIARRIEDELTYPGEVRVTVIREARATEMAR